LLQPYFRITPPTEEPEIRNDGMRPCPPGDKSAIDEQADVLWGDLQPAFDLALRACFIPVGGKRFVKMDDRIDILRIDADRRRIPVSGLMSSNTIIFNQPDAEALTTLPPSTHRSVSNESRR